MCCILENYQTPTGVTVPEVLRPFMGGIDFIPYDEQATATFFKKQEEEAKREAEKAKKGGNKPAKAAKANNKPDEEKKEAAPKKTEKPVAAAVKQVVIVPPQPEFKVNPRHDALEVQLAGNQWLGGNKLCAADRDVFNEIKDTPPRPESHPNAYAWFAMVGKFSDAIKAKWTGDALIAAPAAPKKTEAKPAAAAEDEFDPFAEDPEADAAAAAAIKAKEQAAKDKKKKAAPIAKSIILWEVKPWGEETDLDALAAKILAIEMDGLAWKSEYKKEPIAYGVFKIIIGAVVEDEKVSTDIVQEKIEEFEDDV